MARHLRTILGDMLVTQALDSPNPEELPSPEVMHPSPQPGWREVWWESASPNWLCYLSGSGPLTSPCLNLSPFLCSSDVCHPLVLSFCCPLALHS